VLLRNTILDAVNRLVRDRGGASTTMSDVASSAGISRQTVYNEFGTRADLAQAYVLQQAGRFVEEVSQAIRTNRRDPHAAVTAAVEVHRGWSAARACCLRRRRR
jgi:AcrR family transcriptional regulator